MKLVVTYLACLTLLPGVWLTDFETAKNTAVTENKYILLNFSGSDWCAPCIKLKQEVFESETFNLLAEKNLVLLRADFPRMKKNQLSREQTRHNELLAEKYNHEGKFPLTILLDSKGNVIKQWDGYTPGTREKFITEIETSLIRK